VLDRSKVPSDLWVRAVWEPEPGRADKTLAFVSDRRRWVPGAAVVGSGFVLLVLIAVARLQGALMIFPLMLSVLGLHYIQGGQGGWYEVNADGSLGDFLGQRQPELTWMRLTR
jgi:hypothetical protein